MNIDGLSESTIEKLVSAGLVKELADLFHVDRFEKEFVEMDGFGKKSFENLCRSVEAARDTTPDRLLYSLGISGIGKANAKLIAKFCNNKWAKIENLTFDELVSIDGIGEVMAGNFCDYFGNGENRKAVDDILKEIRLDEREDIQNDKLKGLTFVITGSLVHYENRDALKEVLEQAGAKVAGSVSCLLYTSPSPRD